MRPYRTLARSLLAVPLLVACGSSGDPEPGPGQDLGPAARPAVLVAAHDDGRLVRVELGGTRPDVTTLLPWREGMRAYPTQVLPDGDVVVAETTEGSAEALHTDVAVVDPETGDRRALTRNRRTVRVLIAPDGRRYVLDSPDSGIVTSVHRTAADGESRETLIPEADDVTITAAALSPDGRTLYVARTPDEKSSELLAIDTASGDRRTVRHGMPYEIVVDLAVSPDGRLLAASFADWDGDGTHAALVPAAGGEPRRLAADGDLRATAFARDGRTVVLSLTKRTHLGEDRYEYDFAIAFADVGTGRVERIRGTDGLRVAVSVD